ncbi:hypothetical protein PTI98_013614 [Pleurotus ostreatus]|nr:hypothetical protein PTI98_013614 [Pleurotus ostreatus]
MGSSGSFEWLERGRNLICDLTRSDTMRGKDDHIKPSLYYTNSSHSDPIDLEEGSNFHSFYHSIRAVWHAPWRRSDGPRDQKNSIKGEIGGIVLEIMESRKFGFLIPMALYNPTCARHARNISYDCCTFRTSEQLNLPMNW